MKSRLGGEYSFVDLISFAMIVHICVGDESWREKCDKRQRNIISLVPVCHSLVVGTVTSGYIAVETR